MDVFEAVHAELGLAQYERELRAVTGLWRSLEVLRAKARKDPKLLQQYRTLLERSIARIRESEEDALRGEAEAEAGKNYITWYEAEQLARGIPEREKNRSPVGMENWMAKWHPEIYARYAEALSQAIKSPSGQGFERLKTAATAMMTAFTDGF